MNVISRKKLRVFYESRVQSKKHVQAFEEWYKISKKAVWHHFQDTRASFGQTDVASDTRSGKTATIFDIGGNKYRIVALVDYLRQTVLITHVMDHAEYSRMKWKQRL